MFVRRSTFLFLGFLLAGCNAPLDVLDKSGCALAAKEAQDAGTDFGQEMRVCKQDSDCVVYTGVCQPDTVNARYESCAIWQSNEIRKSVKCAAYFGDISKVTASCDSGLCVAHDPWKTPY